MYRFSPPESLREALSSAGRDINITVPSIPFVLSILGQYFFTDFFKDAALLPLIFCVATVSILIVTDIVFKKQGYLLRSAQYVLLCVIAVVLTGFLMPFPSPYLIYIILLAMLIYFDLGLKAMVASLVGILGSLLAIYTFRGPTLAGSDDGIFYVTIVAIGVMSYYIALFLKVVQREITTERESADEAIRHQQQVDSLINNMTDGVIAIDGHHRVTTYNGAALDVLDLNTSIQGRLLSRIFKPIDAESQPVSITKLLKQTTAPTINRDLRIKYSDGSTSNIFLAIAPIYLGYGKSENNGFTMLLRDITREKSLEEERDEFISVVSHELRTPIAISEGNISNAEFIAEKSGDMATVKQALAEAHRQVLFLADMINDLSTLSRAERGVLEVEAEPINVHDLCEELRSNYTKSAEDKGLKLAVEIDPKLEILSSSKLYVREILQNFITNSIKYTEAGSVTIAAKAHPRGVNFAIRDTGIGISKADQERVFDKFFRSEDYRTRKNNGTGLGLYVTMKLIRLIHAEVSVESELDKGSTFTIFIPDFNQD